MSFYVTKEGFNDMKEELVSLQKRKQEDTLERLKEAKAHGDLKENAEYSVAKEELAMINRRIQSLEKKIKVAQIIDEKQIDKNKVLIGATVTIEMSGRQMVYTIVSAEEADFPKGKISVDSPIGASLLGKEKGEEVLIEAPVGQLKCMIKDITRGGSSE